MSKILVNTRLQDWAKSEKQNKVVPGCGDSEQHDEGHTPKKAKTTISKSNCTKVF